MECYLGYHEASLSLLAEGSMVELSTSSELELMGEKSQMDCCCHSAMCVCHVQWPTKRRSKGMEILIMRASATQHRAGVDAHRRT